MTREVELQSPSVPLFQGGILSVGVKPLFEKEGKGRFFAKANRNYILNFWDRTLVTDKRTHP